MNRAIRPVAFAAAGLAAVLVVQLSPASSADSGHGKRDLLRSGVAASLSSAGPVLFGAAAGGAPWVIDRGRVEVDKKGRLRVRVEGLVIPPPTRPNTNPLDFLGASLVCNGVVAATTAPEDFSDDGDARIREDLEVPDDCLAPVVLLHPATATTVNTAVYIAASGS